jgi:CheY-like chemotaxis protein
MDNLGYILLADDNEDDLELETRALAQYRIANEIIVVRDGAEALDFLYRRGDFSDRNPTDPLVVLLDINMPRLNGLEVSGANESRTTIASNSRGDAHFFTPGARRRAML